MVLLLTNSITIKKNNNYYTCQQKNLIFVTAKNAEKLLTIFDKKNYEFSKRIADMRFLDLTKTERKRSFVIGEVKSDFTECYADELGKIFLQKKGYIEVKKIGVINHSLTRINKKVIDVAMKFDENPAVEVYEQAIKYTFKINKIAIYELLDNTDDLGIMHYSEDEEILAIDKYRLGKVVEAKKASKIRLVSKDGVVIAKPLKYYMDYKKEDEQYEEHQVSEEAEFDFTIDIPIKIIKEVLKRKYELLLTIKENKKNWIINDSMIFSKVSEGVYF